MDSHAASEDQKIMPMKSPENILVILFQTDQRQFVLMQLGEYPNRDTTCVVHCHHVYDPAIK